MILRVINTLIILLIIILAIVSLFIVPLTSIIFGFGPT